MKHKSFENRILDRLSLPPDQDPLLDQHLRGCDSCFQFSESVKRVDRILRSAPPVWPPPDFLSRWQIRFESALQRQFRRLTLGTLTFFGGGAAILFWVLVGRFVSGLGNLPAFLASFYERLLGWLGFFHTLSVVIPILARNISEVFPLPLWMGAFGLAGGSALLWLKAARKLAYYHGALR